MLQSNKFYGFLMKVGNFLDTKVLCVPIFSGKKSRYISVLLSGRGHREFSSLGYIRGNLFAGLWVGESLGEFPHCVTILDIIFSTRGEIK